MYKIWIGDFVVMSVQVKTPTHTSSFEGGASEAAQPRMSSDSAKKRR